MRWMSPHTPVRRWLPLAVLGAFTLGLAAWLLTGRQADAAAGSGKTPPPVPVRVATVVQDDVVVELQAVGRVEASAQAVVQPRVEGLLTQLTLREGQAVQAGAVLARLDDRQARAEVARWQAQVDQLAAQRQQAQADLSRFEALAQQAAVSSQQRDQQAALVAQLDAQWRAARASLDAAQVQLDHTTIRAPIAGRVGLRQVDVGNIVRPADAQGLVTITRLSPVQVVFAVPQGRWAEVRDALAADRSPAVMLTEAAGAAQTLKGQLITRDNQIDTATGTLRLKAEFGNADERLLPGQAVTVRLPVRRLPQVQVLPASAVQNGQRGPMVWRLKTSAEGPTQVEPVTVELVWRDDARAAVSTVLSAGDRVVTDGHARLKPGASVRVLTPPVESSARPGGAE